MAEGITVFFSYSHRDEVFRKELEKYLSILRRQGVISEWHDRKIVPGVEWSGEIDEHLNTAHIILLLISPDFLASDYCYEVEMRRAVARHDAGEARVIPIIIRAVDWEGAPFGKLQALPKDAKPVAQWRTLDEGFVDVARGIRTTIQAMTTPPPKPVHPKKEPPTHIVDQMYRGDFVTISEAIAAAKPGDRILVRPGLYNEGLVIDKPLEIVGDGERSDIVVQVSGKNVVFFHALRGRITNLTMRQLGGEWYCVYIPQGRLDLEDCDITSLGSACIGIRNGADPRVRRNWIHDSQSNGVYVDENGHGTLEDNEIVGNALPGVYISSGANPLLRRNLIRGGKQNGVRVTDNGQGVLEDNDILANVQPGIVIDKGGNPVLRRNRIHDGQSYGVWVKENGRGTLEDNEIVGNAMPGVVIDKGGKPVLRRNHIANNGYYGIWILEGSGGTFENNDLRDNARGAWRIDASSLPNVTRRNNTPNE